MSWLFELPLLVRGLIIGLAISAPVGPIGLLCIQRTLAHGRLVGLVTGLGAATADAVYGAIAALGVTVIAEALVGRQDLLRVAGGLFLLFLAIRIFRAEPPTELENDERQDLIGAYASTFILTLTNPVTIIFFAAVFAGIGDEMTNRALPAVVPLVMGVFLGSALWWLLLSGGVSLIRDRLSQRSLRWINRGAGLLIALFGLSAIYSVISGLML